MFTKRFATFLIKAAGPFAFCTLVSTGVVGQIGVDWVIMVRGSESCKKLKFLIKQCTKLSSVAGSKTGLDLILSMY